MQANKRLQLELPEKSMGRLLGLKNKTEAASYTEVVKNALRLYEAVIEEADKGNTFCVKDREGSIKEYLVF